jgi:hypothetical protein
MRHEDILDAALFKAGENINIETGWAKPHLPDFDASIQLYWDEDVLNLHADVKKEIRSAQLPKLREKANRFKNFILIAHRLFPNQRKDLKNMHINYMEANGNIYYKDKKYMIYIDHYPTLKEKKQETNRIFTKTGLKVLFQLLAFHDTLNYPQREIAENACVALGNIPLVIKGLLEAGYIVRKNDKKYQWRKRDEIIERWVFEYQNVLKPTIFIGSFEVPEAQKWDNIELRKGDAFWGGEPGGDLLTNHLRPEHFTLYTDLSKKELILDTGFKPVQNGNLDVYQTFWKQKINDKAAPPLLIYADLWNNEDKRNRDTAQLIYERYIQNL